MVSGCSFWWFFVLGIPISLTQNKKILFANVLEVTSLRSIKKFLCIGYFQTCYVFFGGSASMLCILFSIFEVLGKWFLHQCWPSLFYFVLLTTWSTICTSKFFILDKKELEAGWHSTRQQNNQMSLFISLIPPQPLCFKDTPKTICTLSEQKCFYYRNPPSSTWIVARAFWTSAQSQHFGL